MKTKITHYKFWITHKQFYEMEIHGFHSGWTKADIKEELARWCSKFSFWFSGDSIIKYGMEKIKIPSRKILLKKWTPLCKKRNEINTKWEVIRQMLLYTK